MKQLIGINTHRGHPHTAAHYRDPLPAAITGITKHIAYAVKAKGLPQVIFCNPFGTGGVPGHQYGFGDLPRTGAVMGGRGIKS